MLELQRNELLTSDAGTTKGIKTTREPTPPSSTLRDRPLEEHLLSIRGPIEGIIAIVRNKSHDTRWRRGSNVRARKGAAESYMSWSRDEEA